MPKQKEEKNAEITTPIDTLDDLLINDTNEVNDTQEKNTSSKKRPNKIKKYITKLKKWWHNLPKNKKIILIIVFVLILILIGIGIFAFIKNSNTDVTYEEPEKEDVIIELENYRYENGTLIFLNDNDEELGSYECENQEEDLCFVAYYNTEDTFDVLKKQYEDETVISERTPIINNNYVFISDNKTNEDATIKLYDINEQKISEEQYRLVKKGASETDFIVKNTSGSYGVVNITEEVKTAIPFNYDYLGYIENSNKTYISKQKNRMVLIDQTGKNISKTIPGEIKGLTPSYVKIQDDTGSYSVYDYNGTEIFTGYDYIELYPEYAALINNKELYLQFYNKTKINEEGIKLLNTDYVKTNIYDENNKLKETKEAFALEENDNVITISVVSSTNTKNTTINKLEALNNQQIKYINYLNGKLYIYRDEEKTNLLGTYSCNNLNNIKSKNDGLTNCSIAIDSVFENNEIESAGSVGYIPVLNERYIFINDNPELVNDSNKTVILYDLSTNKIISKYNTVATYTYTGKNELSFATVEDYPILAKNKSNKFGAVKIDMQKVSAYIPFQYDSLEKFGDYYLGLKDNNYTLINKQDGKTADYAPVPGKIRDYNEEYLTALENNAYVVYNKKGEKITSNSYNYIGLYPTFYATVDSNNKLGLYLYDKPDTNFLDKDIVLSSNKYYGSGTLAFRITISGKQYTILLGNSNDSYTTGATGPIPTKEDLEKNEVSEETEETPESGETT